MEKITGKNNDLIKNVKKLLSSSKERRVQGLFVLEGARLVFDVLNSFLIEGIARTSTFDRAKSVLVGDYGSHQKKKMLPTYRGEEHLFRCYKIKYFLITQSAYDKYKEQSNEMIKLAQNSFFISGDVAEKLSDTKNSQGVFAVCCVDSSDKFESADNARLIALDNVQDPGNLGTIVRTAEALGIDGVIVGGGCDIYNPKVLRASMGSMLRMNIMQTDTLADMLIALKQKGLTVYGTSPDSNAKNITEIDFSNGGVCVIGNEANGISDEIKTICDMLITIPMLGRAESLNASVAASITMWEMLR